MTIMSHLKIRTFSKISVSTATGIVLLLSGCAGNMVKPILPADKEKFENTNTTEPPVVHLSIGRRI